MFTMWIFMGMNKIQVNFLFGQTRKLFKWIVFLTWEVFLVKQNVNILEVECKQ